MQESLVSGSNPDISTIKIMNKELDEIKELDQMSAIEIANYEFSFHPSSEKAIKVRNLGNLSCEIVCESGKVFKVMGLLAHELVKALHRDSKNSEESFKKELKELLNRYDFKMYIDFDSRGGSGGWYESVLMVKNQCFDCDVISFDLDEIVERKIHR